VLSPRHKQRRPQCRVVTIWCVIAAVLHTQQRGEAHRAWVSSGAAIPDPKGGLYPLALTGRHHLPRRGLCSPVELRPFVGDGDVVEPVQRMWVDQRPFVTFWSSPQCRTYVGSLPSCERAPQRFSTGVVRTSPCVGGGVGCPAGSRIGMRRDASRMQWCSSTALALQRVCTLPLLVGNPPAPLHHHNRHQPEQ
jgi:hypothetical protein